MTKSGMSNTLTRSALVLILCSALAPGASLFTVSGGISGIVRDASGIPQMGASVVLINRYERAVMRSLTNEKGAFGFDLLPPDRYSVQVSLPSFVPAAKQIAVQAGVRSLLSINLASVLSSIELVYALPGQSALMSDDWKWALRSGLSTRPILRFVPVDPVSVSSRPSHSSGPVFSETRGLLKVSAGDSAASDDMTWEPDLGTAFALSTSVFGRNQLQFSGNVGKATRSGLPAAGFRARFSREGGGPKVAVVMRQVYLPSRGLAPLNGQSQEGLPALRTLSVTVTDGVDLTDQAHVEYGVSADAISFTATSNFASPFARLTYDLGTLGTLRAGFSSGAPPSELFAGAGEPETELRHDLNALTLSPRISIRDGRMRVQRTQTLEIGLEKKIGGTTANMVLYRDDVTNAAFTVAGGFDSALRGDILPSFTSRGNTLNLGNYRRLGYSAGITQRLGDRVEAGVSVGRAGALTSNPAEPSGSGDAKDVRASVRLSQRYWASARLAATLPVVGARVSANYQWMNQNSLMPNHLYLTQKSSAEGGLNVEVRQPIRNFTGGPGRLEATAELRNALAQGYLPVPGGVQRILIMQSPRAIRGGLSFIF